MKSKNKNTSKPTEKSVTSTSSTSTKANTTIDTLKRFWKQNWHRILSAFSVLLVVCSIAFSCGVNSKAYETSPPHYTPYTFFFNDLFGVSSYTVDPNEASLIQGFPDIFEYQVVGTTNTAYILSHTTDPITGFALVGFFNEVDTSSAVWHSRDAYLHFDCLDFTPTAFSGYLDEISIVPGTYAQYSRQFSPLAYIWPCYDCSDVDYSPPSTDILVSYSYLDGTTIRSHTERFQFTFIDSPTVSRSSESILDQIPLDSLPDNSWITAIDIDIAPIISDFADTYPDSSESLAFDVIQLERPSQAAEMSTRFLSALLSPSIVVPDEEGSYQEGYLDGLNKGQTESLGIVDWLVEAGDSFMNFQLFRVGSTPVSVGTLFSVIIGTFLLFFILRIFAGG